MRHSKARAAARQAVVDAHPGQAVRLANDGGILVRTADGWRLVDWTIPLASWTNRREGATALVRRYVVATVQGAERARVMNDDTVMVWRDGSPRVAGSFPALFAAAAAWDGTTTNRRALLLRRWGDAISIKAGGIVWLLRSGVWERVGTIADAPLD